MMIFKFLTQQMQLKLDSVLDKFTFLTFNLIGSPCGTLTLTVRVLTSSDIFADGKWQVDAGINNSGTSFFLRIASSSSYHSISIQILFEKIKSDE